MTTNNDILYTMATTQLKKVEKSFTFLKEWLADPEKFPGQYVDVTTQVEELGKLMIYIQSLPSKQQHIHNIPPQNIISGYIKQLQTYIETYPEFEDNCIYHINMLLDAYDDRLTDGIQEIFEIADQGGLKDVLTIRDYFAYTLPVAKHLTFKTLNVHELEEKINTYDNTHLHPILKTYKTNVPKLMKDTYIPDEFWWWKEADAKREKAGELVNIKLKELYFQACQAYKDTDFYIGDMMYWLREPDKYEEVDMVEMITAWGQLMEYNTQLESIGKIPNYISPDKEEEEEEKGNYTLENLLNYAIDFEAELNRSEDHNPDLFQSTLQKYMDQHLKKYKEMLDLGMQDKLEYDSDDEVEVTDVLYMRDTLEFFRAGLNMLRASSDEPGIIRMPKIDYHGFAKTIRQWDETYLRPLVKKYKAAKAIHYFSPEHYIPDEFWWWK